MGSVEWLFSSFPLSFFLFKCCCLTEATGASSEGPLVRGSRGRSGPSDPTIAPLSSSAFAAAADVRRALHLVPGCTLSACHGPPPTLVTV